MILNVEGVQIYFPYDKIYPEQLKYMKALLKCIKQKGHCLLEMPSGTGKTVSLLSCTVSYQIHCKMSKTPFKIIYCSRTLPEIEKTISELKNLISYIKKYVDFKFLAMGLSKRANLCINEQALKSFDVELTCRKMINHLDNMNCDFFENTNNTPIDGVYDFADIIKFGKENGLCPYFFIRNNLQNCDCIIYPYNYLIDPSIYSIISRNLSENSVVIFDEAHNIDSHCIEALSIDINRNILEASTRIIKKIEEKIKNDKSNFSEIIKKEYDMLKVKKDFYIENTIPSTLKNNTEFMPGNLRSASHFLSIIKRFIEFLKTKLKTTHLTVESIKSFLDSVADLTLIDKKSLKFVSQRMGILIQCLEIVDDEIYKLMTIANLGTRISLYSTGFSIIFEPYDTMSGVFNPVLRLSCNDASIAIKHVFEKFKNVIITSGTLSPIEMYPKLLNFVPVESFEVGATLDRNAISPMIINKGNDQIILKSDTNDDYNLKDDDCKETLTTSFKNRTEPSVVRNYGSLIIALSQIVPDNIVVFFPSYIYMEEIISLWSATNIISDILENKLVFIETPDFHETELALKNYRMACDSGRGAILFSVARGKVSEGVDFEHGYGRAVVMLGIPFMFTESLRLKERLRYMKTEYGIKEYDFLVFDAMRHTAQCLGRVLRNKKDYGIMILADSRFMMPGKITKLPKWIQDRIEKGNIGVSVDMAMCIAKNFFREMSQPISGDGNTLFDVKDAAEFLAKLKK